MKVIPLHIDQKRLIKKAIKQDRAAQKTIYERHSPKMLSVCRLYIKDAHFAEDVMLRGFFKVFKNLKSFGHNGSFEGWIRRIMVHEAIDFLRAKKQLDFSASLEEEHQLSSTIDSKDSETDYIQRLIDNLPEGYRVVFVMYAVEGYKHREIADALGIAVGTSKSQLAKARKMLQRQLKENELNYGME